MMHALFSLYNNCVIVLDFVFSKQLGMFINSVQGFHKWDLLFHSIIFRTKQERFDNH